MADMPTIYPMRFPSIPAQRTSTNVDDLLPSTYMDRPTVFTSAMQNVGKMLGQKQNDLDEANLASMKYGPQAAPGQIAALNDYLFKRGGTPYGGVMSPDGSQTLQVPGGEPSTPFNTAGQVAGQTNAEQALAAKMKADKIAADQELMHQKLDQQQKQFEQRSAQRDAELKEKAAYHEHTNARLLVLGNRRLAQTGEGMRLKQLADVDSKRAGQAFSNARSLASQAAALEKAMASDFTMSPDVKAQRQADLKELHDKADAELSRAYEIDARVNSYVDQATGRNTEVPATPAAQPQTTLFKFAGQNPRFPNAAYGTVNGVPGWYEKDANGTKTKVE